MSFAMVEAAAELWMELRPLKNLIGPGGAIRKLRNRRRARLGLPLLPTDPPTQETTMPQGTMTKSGILVMIAAAILAPLLVHFGLPAVCPVDHPNCTTASSLATTILTVAIGSVGAVVAWLGKNRGLSREALLKQALVDLLGKAAADAVHQGVPLSQIEPLGRGPTVTPAPLSGGG
jgi:hypothetical protein